MQYFIIEFKFSTQITVTYSSMTKYTQNLLFSRVVTNFLPFSQFILIRYNFEKFSLYRRFTILIIAVYVFLGITKQKSKKCYQNKIWNKINF